MKADYKGNQREVRSPAPGRAPSPAQTWASTVPDGWRLVGLQRAIGNRATVDLLGGRGYRSPASRLISPVVAGRKVVPGYGFVQRTPEEDAPEVASALYGAEQAKARHEEALTLLRTAEAMKFYDPVKKLALTGKVLNPDGLMVLVQEFHAKAREEKDRGATHGLVRELLYALARATTGQFVQLGGWRPDHLQKGLANQAKQSPPLDKYLKGLETEELPLQTGWGGDVAAWEVSPEKLTMETVQHKVIEGKEQTALEKELIKAATQLAGQNTEKALPQSRRVADLVVFDASNPVQGYNGQRLRELAESTLSKNVFGKKPLTAWVDEVRIATRSLEVMIEVKREDLSGPMVVLALVNETPEIVAETEKNTPTTQAEALAEPKKEAKHSEEKSAYEKFARQRNEYVELKAAQVTKNSAEEQAQEFIESGWSGFAKSKKEAQTQSAYQEQFKKSQDLVKGFTARKGATKKLGEAEWALSNPTEAAAIESYDLGVAATKLLGGRRSVMEEGAKKKEPAKEKARPKKKEPEKEKARAKDEEPEKEKELAKDEEPEKEKENDWTTLKKVRDQRTNFVRGHMANNKDASGQDAFEEAILDWEQDKAEQAKQCSELEKKLDASFWIKSDDAPGIQVAIRKIVEAEKVIPIEGVKQSAAESQKRKERRDRAKEQGALEEKTSFSLAAAIKGRLDTADYARVFQQVATVKDSEGNARAVSKIIENLALTLAQAWKFADAGLVDKDTLAVTTKELVKATSGVRYLALLAEFNEVVRQANAKTPTDSLNPVQDPLFSGQWYALELGTHKTWEEADAEARKAKDPAKAQEVDVSHFENGKWLHVTEVASDVTVLDDKVRSPKKEKQRTGYLALAAKRNAKVSYAVDSEAGWEKIFEWGTTREQSGLEAPIVKWFLDNDITLIIKGRVLDRNGFEDAWSAVQAESRKEALGKGGEGTGEDK